jgi:hypothetical protein
MAQFQGGNRGSRGHPSREERTHRARLAGGFVVGPTGPLLPLLPDSVEEVGFRVLATRRWGGRGAVVNRTIASRCRDRRQLGEFSEVLSCGSEVEFIASAIRPAQSEPIQLQDAFEVGEQHLDFFALAARGLVVL